MSQEHELRVAIQGRTYGVAVMILRHNFGMTWKQICDELRAYHVTVDPKRAKRMYRNAWKQGQRPSHPNTPEWFYAFERFPKQ